MKLPRLASRSSSAVAVAAFALLAAAGPAAAVSFTLSYTDGGSWNSIYAQGFSPSVAPNPNPALAADATVYLDQFRFFKSGSDTVASNVRLAILNSYFTNLQGLNSSWSVVTGLSTNTLASTGSLATGDPIDFTFDHLPLVYGGSYAAVFVNVAGDGSMTPVLVPALVTNYTETPPGSGSYHPASNYGTEDQYLYSVSNFINSNEFGSFFSAFSFGGDANFIATLNTTGASIPGDLDGDGDVDRADFDRLLENFGQSTGGGAAAGDLNGDGKVSADDLAALNLYAAQYIHPTSAAVPEPALVAAIPVAAWAMARRRARK